MAMEIIIDEETAKALDRIIECPSDDPWDPAIAAGFSPEEVEMAIDDV